MLTLVRMAQIAFFIVAAVALVIFIRWKWPSERRLDLDTFQQALVERVVDETAQSLPAREDVRKLVFVPVPGDLDGHVADMLEGAVAAEGRYELVTGSRVTDAVKSIAPGGLSTRAQAVEVARLVAPGAKADGLLFATVDRTSGDHGLGAKVALESHLVRLSDEIDVQGGDVRKEASIESRASLSYLGPWMQSLSRIGRLVAWLLFTAALPFAFHPVIARVTALESNRWNGALIGGLTLASALVAWFCMGLRVTFFDGLLVLLAALAAFIYHFNVSDRIDEARR